MKKIFRFLGAAALFAIAMPGLLSAATYNLEDDFSETSNANGAWSYGFYSTLNASGSYSLLNTQVTDAYGSHFGVNGWTTSGGYPNILQNQNGSSINLGTVQYAQNAVTLHPSNSGLQSVIRWTAPNAGSFGLSGFFQGVDFGGGTTTDVQIFKNGNLVSAGDILAFLDIENFGMNFGLGIGDTLDFVVGNGGNNFVFDTTRLSLNISDIAAPIPLPATLPLLLAGLGGLVMLRMRSRT